MVLPTESPALGKIRRKGVCFWFWPLILCMCVVVDEVVIAVFKQRRGFISMYVWKNKCESRDFQTIRIAHISFSVSLRLAYPRGQHWGIALATVEPHGGGREVPQNSGAVIIRRRERCWIQNHTDLLCPQITDRESEARQAPDPMGQAPFVLRCQQKWYLGFRDGKN